MDQAQTPLLSALADYHHLGRYGFNTAFRNWHASDRNAQRDALRRVGRIHTRRRRVRARRQLLDRLYRDPLPMKITTAGIQ